MMRPTSSNILALLILGVWTLTTGLALQQPALFPPTVGISRRATLEQASSAAAAAMIVAAVVAGGPTTAYASVVDPKDVATQIQQARQQLEKVPGLIQTEKWDSIRAILIAPPLADCWAKTNRPILSNLAQALDEAGGDELAALEAKEEVVSHLRYLDMAVYNNVFNPIKAEGASGATKELIRSYYEDPLNEWKASVAALDELVQLSKGL